MKLFLYTWFNFIWMFVAVMPLLGAPDRSMGEWLLRGVIGGFVLGILAPLIDRRRRASQLRESVASEQLEPAAESVDARAVAPVTTPAAIPHHSGRGVRTVS